MLEVCFSDSVKGALSLAQNCGKEIGGATSIAFLTDKKSVFSFFAKGKALREFKKRQVELQKVAVPLGGKREDIVGISFGLSESDIYSPICFEDCPRKDYIHSMLSFDRYNEQEDMETSINEFWRYSMNDLEKLKSKPARIRVWLDHTPDAQCGLLFVADLLKDSNTEIHIVELPQRITREDNCIVEYRGWGDVEPELFGTFLDRERILDYQEIEKMSKHWQMLKTENAPLRVVENNIVISADESYYDDLIRKEFPKDTCRIGQMIGGALGKQKILTGDVFIAKRIQTFIENGELAVILPTSDGFYRAVVQPAKHLCGQ